MFVDKVNISMQAGNGGNGRVSFRHEKFIDRGGPDGGDGGKGGDIIFRGSRNQNTLAAFRYQREVKAEPGKDGGQVRKHGRSGKNIIVDVPVGTVITSADGVILADLATDQQEVMVAAGGRGGFGNAHFISSRRQAPAFAEKGEAGIYYDATLELKMIADVALVGMPNAGKSTLLSVISNARPEIANYPFTTLTPNLGVVDVDTNSLLFADIPGLIEGASNGKGLGHAFLRHIERTAVIVHLIDAYQDDVAGTYTAIRQELEAYKSEITDRPEIIAINKTEGLDEVMVADIIEQLRTVVPEDTPIFAISAQAKQGLKTMLYAVSKAVAEVREAAVQQIDESTAGIPVLKITNTESAYSIEKYSDGSFHITGDKIVSFAARTDFENEQGVQRLRDIMGRLGVMHELRRQQIEPGALIYFGIHGPMVY